MSSEVKIRRANPEDNIIQGSLCGEKIVLCLKKNGKIWKIWICDIENKIYFRQNEEFGVRMKKGHEEDEN